MSKQEMPKAYDASLHEDEIYAVWEKSGYFNPDNLSGDPYSIMMPPPNVTGILHLGHALENALMDAMARYQRLRGKKVLLMPGTDHAAVATQAKVEKMLMDTGMKNPRQELGREKLVEKIREFAEQSRSTILNQIKKMGTSCDWSRLAYTFDEPRNIAVNELFRQMYEDGLIYRGHRVVNWSVKGQSTCSDDEVAYVERASVLYTFKYSKDFPITIATTRPETKLGDTAVAVHPSDVRYQKYIGQTFVVDVGAEKPREIKIIADENVDPQFGTGALGVTCAHSPVDFLMYEKQKANGTPIELIQVIGTDGRMTKEAGSYAGLTVEEARAKFVAWLLAEGLMMKEPEEMVQNVGTSDRFGDVIESLPMTQWWLDVQKMIPSRGKSLRDLMKEALTTGLNGDATQKVEITPERFTKLYLDRVDHLRDWCLSRQTWWGHRIPVWYRGEETFVGNGTPKGDGWQQDEDTLDTWFSSGSWTFSTLGWPQQTEDLKTFHPTDWMQMGTEILYLWLMRMVLMSTYALKEIPFKNAYIHGLLRNELGQKFSKSMDNGTDPLLIIKQYGCDALRLSVLSGNTPGNDSRFSTEKVENGRNFVNKVWNISRFILTCIDPTTLNKEDSESITPKTLADKWILSRLETTVHRTETLLEQYDFSLAIEIIRDFIWNDFADWYLEIAKVQQRDETLKPSTDAILLFVLERILIVAHPFMPFVTETIWKQLSDTLLLVQPWPLLSGFQNPEGEETFDQLKEIVVSLRNIRAQYKIEMNKLLEVTISAPPAHHEMLLANAFIIKTLARVETLHVQTYASVEKDVAMIAVKDLQITVSLVGLVDQEKEKARVQKEIEEATAYIASISEKLSNEEFRSKAPEKVIAQMEQKKLDAQEKLKILCT